MKTKCGKVVLVLGGKGFIGRHIADHLHKLGATVLLGSRRKSSHYTRGERRIALHRCLSSGQWKPHLKDVDVVVNAVGILRQRYRETYDQVHRQAVAALAQACEQSEIRLVHVSALGLTGDLQSQFSLSKLRGEQAIAQSKADWEIVRASLVLGDGAYGGSWFARLAQWPVHFVPAASTGRISPIQADDLGEAVARLAMADYRVDCERSDERIWEVSCGEAYTVPELLRLLSDGRKRSVVRVPAALARPLAHLCDLFHLTPFSFGHYELLKRDNQPNKNRLQDLLGRPAQSLRQGGLVRDLKLEEYPPLKNV